MGGEEKGGYDGRIHSQSVVPSGARSVLFGAQYSRGRTVGGADTELPQALGGAGGVPGQLQESEGRMEALCPRAGVNPALVWALHSSFFYFLNGANTSFYLLTCRRFYATIERGCS